MLNGTIKDGPWVFLSQFLAQLNGTLHTREVVKQVIHYSALPLLHKLSVEKSIVLVSAIIISRLLI
jgi:hypothetical protein